MQSSKKFVEESHKYYTIALIAEIFVVTIPIGIPAFICGVILGKIANILHGLLTEKGCKEEAEWKALAKYMEDFSLLDEREIPDLILWEKYLVFATAFGIADTVIEQLEVKYSNFNDVHMLSSDYICLHAICDFKINSKLSHSINNAVERSLAIHNSYYTDSSRWKWPSVEVSLVVVGGRWRPVAGMHGR